MEGRGTCASPRPKMATIAARTNNAVKQPPRASRQPRTAPTARTIVRASTHSTREARKAANAVGPRCTHTSVTKVFRSHMARKSLGEVIHRPTLACQIREMPISHREFLLGRVSGLSLEGAPRHARALPKPHAGDNRTDPTP